MKIIFIGPPASGKGTQAEMLAQKYNLKLISTGNLFRWHIKNKTELGQKVEQIMTAGDLVSDLITNEIVKEEINKIQDSFVLDGYPRNIVQAKFLNQLIKINLVFEIFINFEEVMRRLSGRRVCSCGATYHLIFKPPQKNDFCDVCGSKLFQRDDDTEKKIKHRYQIYEKKTNPLIDFYQAQNILIKINGQPPIPDVFKEILNKSKKYFKL